MKKLNYLISLLIILISTGCNLTDKTSNPTVTINAMVKTGFTPKYKTSSHLTITEAKLLVRNIEFESALDQDSLDFETGTIIMSLNLNGGITEVAVSEIQPGIYNEIEFDIHKPEDSEVVPDSDFRIGDSGDERFSVVIRGNIDGNVFLYRSNKNFEIELELANNIEILESDNNLDITLTVDISGWFLDEHGNPLDPRNIDHESEIDESIKRSFEAFEDNDRDGDDDNDDR